MSVRGRARDELMLQDVVSNVVLHEASGVTSRLTSGLTDRQVLFCNEYLVDLNATQAAIRAGYSARTATVQASRLLSKPEVEAYLAVLKRAREERTLVDADYVLRRLVEIDEMDVLDVLHSNGTLKAVHEWPKVWRQYVCGIEVMESRKKSSGSSSNVEEVLETVVKKIKWPDKIKNLELIGKHLSIQESMREEERLRREKFERHELEAMVTQADGTVTDGYKELTEVERVARIATLLELARARKAGNVEQAKMVGGDVQGGDE